jgi:hypothetical protein
MLNQTESQNDVRRTFDKAVRQHCEMAGIVAEADRHGLMVRNPATGTRLTLTYQDKFIRLVQSNWGTSYMVYVPCAHGMKLRLTSHPNLRDAYHAARYVVETFLKDQKL